MSKILNLGCGQESYGDVRVDFVKTKTTTHILDLNKKLPFENEEFDEIYSKSVLEHIRNVGLFISEAMRVLKKGGRFWFRTDNASYLGFYFKNHQSYIEDTYEHHTADDRHYYLFKREHLINFFKDYSDKLEICFTAPSKKLTIFPKKIKCMHIEIIGSKN